VLEIDFLAMFPRRNKSRREFSMVYHASRLTRGICKHEPAKSGSLGSRARFSGIITLRISVFSIVNPVSARAILFGSAGWVVHFDVALLPREPVAAITFAVAYSVGH